MNESLLADSLAQRLTLELDYDVLINAKQSVDDEQGDLFDALDAAESDGAYDLAETQMLETLAQQQYAQPLVGGPLPH